MSAMGRKQTLACSSRSPERFEIDRPAMPLIIWSEREFERLGYRARAVSKVRSSI